MQIKDNNTQIGKTIWVPATQVNLHTHSRYCGHGTGEVADYVVSARKNGLEVLGFSEHCPVPDNRWKPTRMVYSQLPAYFSDVERAREKAGMVVLKGAECDYLPCYRSYYEDELLHRYKCDYLIGSIHFIDMPDRKDVRVHYAPISAKELAQYTKQYIDLLESGLFLFGAHPDVCGCSYLEWDREMEACSRAILEVAADLKIPLEINGNGFRRARVQTSKGLVHPYPLEPFWQLAAEYGITVVVNSDAHAAQDVVASFDDCLALAQNCGLKVAGLEISGPDAQGSYGLRYVAQ